MSETRAWQELPGATGIFRAHYKVPFTTPSSTLVDLGDNHFLVYSPGPGLESSLTEITTGNPKLLIVAPSTSHYLGVAPWLKTFPTAEVFTDRGILRKLARKTKQQSLKPIEELAPRLPASLSIHTPPPHFLHETWIRIRQGNTSYWLVSDAFLHFNEVEGNIISKFVLGFWGMKPGLRLHKLFPVGLNKAEFRSWAEPLFNAPGKHVLLPCHQDVCHDPDCGEQLADIVRATV